MSSLTFTHVESASAECPPEDVYVLKLTRIGEFEERGAFQDPETINTQARISFEIVEFDYDEDEDERDWNGVEISDFFVFYKNVKGKTYETWKNDRSNAYKLLTALLGHEPEEGEEIDLQALVGRHIKATIEQKQSGWPKITKPLPYKKRRKKAPVAPEPDVFDEDE